MSTEIDSSADVEQAKAKLRVGLKNVKRIVVETKLLLIAALPRKTVRNSPGRPASPVIRSRQANS